MSPADIVRTLVNQCNLMQLATSQDGQPWVVTVHFYADEDLNLYWSSRDSRRHSLELKSNPKVAATILVHENTKTENWVISLTAEGEAVQLNELDEGIAQAYVDKLLKDPDLPEKIKAGSIPDKWYQLHPSRLVLFDTKDFPTDPRQEVKL